MNWPEQVSALLLALTCLASVCSAAEPNGEVMQTLQVEEHFGVSHPMQVIDFDLKQKVDPAQVHVVNESGQAIPVQILDSGKKVAIQTDLPANSSRAVACGAVRRRRRVRTAAGRPCTSMGTGACTRSPMASRASACRCRSSGRRRGIGRWQTCSITDPMSRGCFCLPPCRASFTETGNGRRRGLTGSSFWPIACSRWTFASSRRGHS